MPSTTKVRLAPGADPVELAGQFGELNLGATDTPSLQGDADVQAAVQAAMAEPLGLPPLKTCFTEDDRVAVALGAGVPHAASVVRGLLAGLAEANIGPGQVDLVTASADPTLTAELGDAVQAGLKLFTHDPADEENLCFAGMDERDAPLRVNRQLFEADVLLPVTCAHAPGHRASHGAYGDLFPAFGDAEAIQRLQGSAPPQEHEEDADRAGWVLGVLITLQVAPGVGGGVAAVFAGEAQQVQRESARHGERQWAAAASEPASLVVVTLAAEPHRQTWQGVGVALDAAARVARDDAAVAVLTRLDSPPPQVLIELAMASDSHEGSPEALQRLQNRQEADLRLARSVAEAVERGPLYLMSGLEPDDVESLGMAPLAGEDELRRLVASRPSVLVLPDAEHVVATLGETESTDLTASADLTVGREAHADA